MGDREHASFFDAIVGHIVSRVSEAAVLILPPEGPVRLGDTTIMAREPSCTHPLRQEELERVMLGMNSRELLQIAERAMAQLLLVHLNCPGLFGSLNPCQKWPLCTGSTIPGVDYDDHHRSLHSATRPS